MLMIRYVMAMYDDTKRDETTHSQDNFIDENNEFKISKTTILQQRQRQKSYVDSGESSSQ